MQYTVHASVSGANGSISPSGDSEVNHGSSITYTITPDLGYVLDSLLVDGNDLVGNVSNNEYTLANITAAHTIVAKFKVAQYTVTAIVSGGNGSISPVGDSVVNYEDTIIYTLTPTPGYELDSLIVDGTDLATDVANSKYTLSNITADHTIIAKFKVAQYTVNASVTGGHGSISPMGDSVVNHGSAITYTITPNAGYVLDSLLVDGTDLTTSVVSSKYTLSNIKAAHTLVAKFKILQYTVNASISGGNGSISPVGDSVVNYGDTIVYTLTPNTGYALDTLLVDGVNSKAQVANNEYTLSSITAAHTLVAKFKLKQYTVHAGVSGGHGSISPSGDSVVNHGSNIIYTITPNIGYALDSLKVDGTDVTASVTNSKYTLSGITAAHTIVAKFKVAQHTVNASVLGGLGSISPSGDSVVNHGSNIIYTITPNIGYALDSLLVDGTNVKTSIANSKYTLSSITAAHAIVAKFKLLKYSVNASITGGHGTILPSGDSVANYG